MSKYSLNVDYFREVDNPIRAFWLGFICADGSIKSNIGGIIKLKNLQTLYITMMKFMV
jgi:hypothetical protein